MCLRTEPLHIIIEVFHICIQIVDKFAKNKKFVVPNQFKVIIGYLKIQAISGHRQKRILIRYVSIISGLRTLYLV
jgi:hypothetical protein